MVQPVHVGIDLAWNVNARTGIAVVDAHGALLSSTAVRTDGEIDAWLAPWLPSVATVAVDAPLVVTNPTGMRDAERAVTRAYGRFHAGCHASNRSMVYMDPPRAWALAHRYGWAVDPGHVGRIGAPGCVEVYPHPATVSLFGLERVLKYKKGPVATRRVALLELVHHLETLEVLRLPGHPRWVWVRAVVEQATRPVQLDAVEDEVDAVLCAHLAWLWDGDRASLHVYGGSDGGFIVAPPPPPRSLGHPHPGVGRLPATR
ncbi:MAG: DUF429 domain-containing protein [Lapillicoccus sp.]